MSLHVYIFGVKCIATLIIKEIRKMYFSFDIDATVIIIFLDNGRDFIIAGNMFKKKNTMIFFVRSPDLKHIPLNIDHSFQIHIRPTCSTCVYIGCSKTPKVQSNCQF